ncbi:MAG: ABC transporter ATP-binding protein [Pseudomonadota bacterium]
MGAAVETSGLSRSFGDFTAVHQIDLAVPQGEVVGFLGPNGAGKTTTIRMLLGLIRPSAGRVMINGFDLATQRGAALAGVGAIVETPALYPNLTGRETLTMAARLLGATRSDVDELLGLLDLTTAADRQVGQYSLGMRQRLALARALMGRPKLLILDEPTNGLDPGGIAQMRALISELPGRFGASVLVSSHLLSEVEQTATQCVLIDHGSIVFQGAVSALQARTPPVVLVETDRPAALVKRFLEQNVMAEAEGDTVRAHLDLDAPARASLVLELVGAGFAVSALSVACPTLEDAFLALTGEGRRLS